MTEQDADIEVDLTLLKVKGNIEDRTERKEYVKGLAGALFMVVQKHGIARMRCVGAAAISNATKAHIIANGEATKKGMTFACVPNFKTITFSDAGGPDVEKTAIVLEIKVVESFS